MSLKRETSTERWAELIWSDDKRWATDSIPRTRTLDAVEDLRAAVGPDGFCSHADLAAAHSRQAGGIGGR